MNFGIEDSPEQGAFRDEVRAFLATAVPDNLEHLDHWKDPLPLTPQAVRFYSPQDAPGLFQV